MNFGTLRLRQRMLVLAASIALSAVSVWGQAQQGGRGGGAGGGGGLGGGAGGVGTRTYGNTTTVGEATVTSDVDSRQLIIVTDALTNENIKKVIASLDRPKPQVLINVVFAQVTHDGSLDLGAEARYQGPIAIKTNPEGIATTNFGIASQRATDNSFFGAFYQIVGRDVNATIHALSGVTKTEILSRPSILTRSSQQATILVGQQVPLLTGSTQNTNSNSITSTVTYQDVGIILRVTPFVTQEGLVEMIVSPEISSLSATTVTIPGAGTSPVIDRRAADTVVVTPSDTTIVIGGLISAQKNDIDNKVPVLGDIPILGYAFKRKKKQDVKTELLIFLTPHVIPNPADIGSIVGQERNRLEMTPKVFKDDEMQRYIGPASAAPKAP
jgi:general secretion pathway protein D